MTLRRMMMDINKIGEMVGIIGGLIFLGLFILAIVHTVRQSEEDAELDDILYEINENKRLEQARLNRMLEEEEKRNG